MSTVVDAVSGDRSDDERSARDPFGGPRIEVDERQLRAVSPGAWLDGVRTRLDDFASRLAYGEAGRR